MASLREQIVAAIAATLTGTPAGANVFRSRAIPITRELSPAIVVTPVSESTEAQIGSRSDRRLQVRVEVIARGTVPDSVADATCVSAHSKILADTRLGGLCFDIEETASDWEIEDADLDAVSVATVYTVVYRTLLKNIDQSG